MKLTRFAQVASVTGVALFMMAANANAATITFNTLTSSFSGGGLSLANSSGAAATLTFVPVPNTSITVPSNVNFGNFTLLCPTCTTTSGTTFNPFIFNLIVTDVTDGNAVGKFVGTSVGTNVLLNQSQITIGWLPVTLGPGTTNATSGNFGPTSFNITATTRIVAPNSGAEVGSTTVEGDIASTPSAGTVPEPATFGMVGIGLVGLGLLRRKKKLSN
jgi:hypothetical protein